MKLEVLFPAEFEALGARDLGQTVCVVFDVLRATSTMVTALAHGAAGLLPVAGIPEALALRRSDPALLLAGERHGLRIPAELAGGISFDLGNSPREFTREKVSGNRIAITTTNGTRALRACASAGRVLACSFLNLEATARCIRSREAQDVLLICSGTWEQTAYEDVLAAGALCHRLAGCYDPGASADSARMARRLFDVEQHRLADAVGSSRNGARLLSLPDLAEDVAFCLQVDRFDLAAALENGQVCKVRV